MKISIVIPCYNCEQTIEKTLESIRNQTVNPFEIILVDDGSTDKTYNKIMELKNRRSDGNLFVFHQTNQGASAARNFGIQKSTGEWIAFCDSDDVWEKNKIQTIIDYLKKNRTIVFCAHAYRECKGNGQRKVVAKIHKNKAAFLQLYNRNFIQTSTVVIKKEILNQVNGFDTRLCVAEDFDLWLRCLKIADFGYIPAILSSYYIRENSCNLSSSEMRMYTYSMKVLVKHSLDLDKYMPLYKAELAGYSRVFRLLVAECFYQFRQFDFKDVGKSIEIGCHSIKKMKEMKNESKNKEKK